MTEAYEQAAAALAAIDVNSQRERLAEIKANYADLQAHRERVRSEIADILKKENAFLSETDKRSAAVAAFVNGDDISAAVDPRPALKERRQQLHLVDQGLKDELQDLRSLRDAVASEHRPQLAAAVAPIVTAARSSIQDAVHQLASAYALVSAAAAATGNSDARALVEALRGPLGLLGEADFTERAPIPVAPQFGPVAASGADAIRLADRAVPQTVSFPDAPLSYGAGIRAGLYASRPA